MSTAYNTVIQTFTTPTRMFANFYQGTLQYVPPDYYSIFYDYPNYYYYTNDYYHYHPYCRYGYAIGCTGIMYPYHYPYLPFNYGYTYASTVTIQPSDNMVRVQQSPEPNGYGFRLNLTRYDGTSITYAHVIQQNLSQPTIQGVATKTNTIINSIVSPVTSAVACKQCVLQHVTDHVSLLQLLLGF